MSRIAIALLALVFALIVWDFIDRWQNGQSLWPVITLLVVASVVALSLRRDIDGG